MDLEYFRLVINWYSSVEKNDLALNRKDVESDIFPSLLPAARTTCPDCPCAPGDSNGEFKPGLDHHMDGFNVETNYTDGLLYWLNGFQIEIVSIFTVTSSGIWDDICIQLCTYLIWWA